MFVVLRGGAQTEAEPAAAARAGSRFFTICFSNDWKCVAGLSTTLGYDDNIYISPNTPRSNFILQLKPTMAIGLGDYRNQVNLGEALIDARLMLDGGSEAEKNNHFFFSYDPTISIFAHTRSADTMDQDLRLGARQVLAASEVRGQLRLSTETDPNAELGGRVKRTVYSGDIHYIYQFSDRITIAEEVSAERDRYSGVFGDTEAFAAETVSWQVAPKTVFGSEVLVGFLQPDNGGDQAYLTPRLKINYAPTELLHISGFAGEDFRQFSDDLSNRTHFVYNASVSYELSANRLIELSAERNISASARYSAENLLSTTYEAHFKQRMFRRYTLSLTLGRSADRYESNSGQQTDLTRKDKLYTLTVVFSQSLGLYSRIGISYLYNKNNSNDPMFRYVRNTIGLNYIYVY
jgi:hypothetical protein